MVTSDPAKMIHVLLDTITRTKTKKTLPLRKHNSHTSDYHYEKISPLYFFHAVHHNKNSVILHFVIADIFHIILKILQHRKNNNMPVKFSKYNHY